MEQTPQANDSPEFDPKCASYHFGIWMIEPEWFKSAVSAVRDGLWRAQPVQVDGEEERPRPRGYVVRRGVAIVPIAGPMMKARSKFGGTSTVDVRTAIRQAVSDDSAQSILLLIDSPGGTVAGTESLAQDVAAADSRKPTYAHIEDLGASAAYYVASQARKITASPTSLVGSLGTMMALDDFSKRYEMIGVKAIVVSSGGMKGAGTEGTEITDEQLAYFQGLVDQGTQHFKNAVMRGRGMDQGQADALFDGRVHDAAKAKKLGLIDDVMSLDSAMSEILVEIESEDDRIDRTRQTAIEIVKRASTLGAVAMNPEELLAGMVMPATTRSHAPEPSPRGDATPVVSTKEVSAMADTTNAPAQTPAAPNASNPQEKVHREIVELNDATMEKEYERGYAKGMADGAAGELARLKAICDACPGQPQIALESFQAGQTPEAVKIAFDAATRERAAAEKREKEIALEAQREIARLRNQIASGGHSGVAIGIDRDGAERAPERSPKEQAEWEWDNRPSVRQTAKSKDIYVLAREAELNGTHRQFKRDPAQVA